MADHQFVLVGGDPALDFVNTIHDWTAAEPRDYLVEFGDVLRFAETAGLVKRSDVRRLSPRESVVELRRLRELRARLHRTFRTAAANQSPSRDDLDALADDAIEAARVTRLHPSRGQLLRRVEPEAAGAATIRLRIVEAAIDLLTSSRMQRVKSCPNCGWLFVDTSKNSSRRWCSMSMCGNSAKARAYYWRTKEESAAE